MNLLNYYLIPLIFLLSLTKPADSDYMSHYCLAITNTINTTYNLEALLLSLTSNAPRSRFHNSSSGEVPGQVIQGLYQCHGDVSLDTCQGCVLNATTEILKRCPNNTASAVIWFNDCLLRFSNESITSAPSVDPSYALMAPWSVNEVETARFSIEVIAALNQSASEAANKESKFVAQVTNTSSAFWETDKLYTLVQCTEDLSAQDCEWCLQTAISYFNSCCSGRGGGRVLYPSCDLRYEVGSFYNTSIGAPQPALAPPVNVSVPIPAQSGSEGKLNATAGNEIVDPESLQFDLSTITTATNNFSEENKLGEGGFGQVFKGTLANGREIAVKRLSSQSVQGAEEFKNEVVLVAKLQHRNLVRLEGYCLDGEEKILVYEFVPNKSLDYFIFDPAKQGLLDWSQRYKIIRGTARGILYLHEDSRLRIIHRDLKASNILLDRDMNPKISDFGIARIFGIDQTRASTYKIVGTFGYMAPEYAMHGEFSVKSDIYSFGVLVLEVITGKYRRNDLLNYVWKHWRDGTPLEVLGPILAETFSRDEVIRSIHIGLLCVQEDPIDRPTMASVVMMLNSSITVASPQQPASFHSRTNQGLDVSKFKSTALSADQNSITDLYPR